MRHLISFVDASEDLCVLLASVRISGVRMYAQHIRTLTKGTSSVLVRDASCKRTLRRLIMQGMT